MGEGGPQVKKKKELRKQNYRQKINSTIAGERNDGVLGGSQYGEFV